jgi:Glycosyl hydrolases family 38 N-terminal domain
MAQPFTIYVMQSAHTDIGYTHPQEQLREMYLEYYDRILDLCRETANELEEHRFKWTCETFWQVQHYMTQRPEREEEFLSYVRRGQIEITALYAHFTDLIDEGAYRRSVQLAVAYCQKHHLPLRTAMHCDINGWPWAVADLLAEYEIPYFISHLNLDMGTDPLGKRGSMPYGFHWPENLRPDAPFRIPRAFWWQGPRGGRVLHWLNDIYLLGNALGLSGSKHFHEEKTRYFTEADDETSDDLYARAQREVPLYIEYLRANGYPYDALLVNCGGFFIDNSPPDTRWCRVIERWNQEHQDIRLRTATVGEWFTALPAHGSQLYPSYQLAWPDSWAHGLGSCTARVAQIRRSQRRRADVEALVTRANVPRASAYFERALEEERMALEHTFGAWSTTRRPTSWLNNFEQNVKDLFFHRSELYLSEAAGAALRTGPRAKGWPPTLYAGSGPREAEVQVLHFTSEELLPDPATQALRTSDGHLYAFQRENDELAHFVAVVPLPAGELSSFELISAQISDPAVPFQVEREGSALVVETAAWRARLETTAGCLRSLVERGSGQEWVNGRHAYGFGQLVHERVIHPWGWRAVGNEQRFLALDVASEKLKGSYPDEPVFARETVQAEGEPEVVHGPIFTEVRWRARRASFGKAQLGWRFYHHLPLVELVVDWDKPWSDVPEAAYVAFPFAGERATLDLETGGGFFRPGSHETGGQLPGTCSSYYTIQRAARITGEKGAKALWLPPDAPLVMTNELNYNRWETEPWEWNGFLASMPVNHYWHTNFPISQHGPFRLRYRLLSVAGYASEEQAIQSAQPVEALGWH